MFNYIKKYFSVLHAWLQKRKYFNQLVFAMSNIYSKQCIIWLGSKKIIIFDHLGNVLESQTLDTNHANGDEVDVVNKATVKELQSILHDLCKKFCKYKFIILIDNNYKIDEHVMLCVKTFGKSRALEQFVRNKFKKDDIFAYYAYKTEAKGAAQHNDTLEDSKGQGSITQKHNPYEKEIIDEVKILTLSTSIDEEEKKADEAINGVNGYSGSNLLCVLKILETNAIIPEGIYFLPLELASIIEICSKKHKPLRVKTTQCFIIFITATSVSGIKILILCDKKIIFTKDLGNEQYELQTKSKEYIYGLIENEITSCLIDYKNYISSNNMRVKIVTLLDKELEDLLFSPSSFISSNNFETASFLNDIYDVQKDQNFDETKVASKYFDKEIVRLVVKHKKYIAKNQDINSLLKLSHANKILFNILNIFVLFVLYLCFETWFGFKNQELKLLDINSKYMQLIKKYSKFEYNRGDIVNAIELADFYNIDSMLSKYIDIPFDLMMQIIAVSSSKLVEVQNISWVLNDIGKLDFEINIEVKIIFPENTNQARAKGYMQHRDLDERFLQKRDIATNEYLQKLQTNAPNYIIKYKYEELSNINIGDILSAKLLINMKPISNVNYGQMNINSK